MANFIQDLRYALRQIRRSPGFFLIAALLIAFGIAANTQIFTLVDALLLRPLPVREPQNLVQLFEIQPKLPAFPYFDYRFFKQLTASSTTLLKCVGQFEWTLALTRGLHTERVHAQSVTENYFDDLGVRALVGRLPGARDSHVAVLSYTYWSQSFGRDPNVLGQTVKLKGHPFTIIGVAPQEFTGTTIDSSPDLWFPFANTLEFSSFPNPQLDTYHVEIIARLRPGTFAMRAQQETALLWTRYMQEAEAIDPENHRGRYNGRLEVRSIAHGLSPLRVQAGTALTLLLSGTGLLLLMVCANVGGLLLARSNRREKEMAVRLALGASRRRIVRQHLTEGLLLTAAGGIAGTLIAFATLPLLLHFMPPARGVGFDPAEVRTLSLDLHPDFRLALFSLAVCAITTLLCAVAPVWRFTRADVFNALKNTMSDIRNRRFQSILCGLQIALCSLLLVSAGWMSRSLWNLRTLKAGFDRDHVVLFSIDPHIAGYTAEQAWALRRRLLDAARALPGVQDVAIAGRALMRGTGLVTSVVLPGQRGDGTMNTSMNFVTPGYFEVMGIRLQSGRVFDEADVEEDGKVSKVVVNEAFVRLFLDGRHPLGRQFGTGKQFLKNRYQVIGVVNDTKYRSLREVPPPMFYTCGFGPKAYPDAFILHVRTRGDPREIVRPVRALLQSIDAEVPLYQAATLSEEVERSLWQERLLVALTSSFGVFAMSLSMIGLYGILAYFVTQRQREIGLRMALGAQPGQVVWLVVRRVLPTLAVGLIAGAILSSLASAWVRGTVYGVQTFDPWSASIAFLLLIAVGIGGAAIPALRAIHVDPSWALRQE